MVGFLPGRGGDRIGKERGGRRQIGNRRQWREGDDEEGKFDMGGKKMTKVALEEGGG